MKLTSRQRLSEIVKKARGEMSQRAFGRKLGVSGTAVRLWEEMETVPDTINLSQIAAHAGYTLEELMIFLEVDKPDPIDSSEFASVLKQMRRMGKDQVKQIIQVGADLLASAS